MSVPKIVVTDPVADSNPRLSRCEELDCDEVARWLVTYTGAGSEPRRNLCCDTHYGLVSRYALDCNTRSQGFYPVEVAPLSLPVLV